MSIPDDKATRVPAPLDKQVRAARRREGRKHWLPYFAGAGAVWPLAELWLVPALNLSHTASHGVALGVAALAGFLTQAFVKRINDPPDEGALPPDRDPAV